MQLHATSTLARAIGRYEVHCATCGRVIGTYGTYTHARRGAAWHEAQSQHPMPMESR